MLLHSLTLVLISSTLIVTTNFVPTQAVQFQVFNNATGTPGGVRFIHEIGLNYSKQILENATTFIWQTFQQHQGKEKRSWTEVTLVVESSEYIAYTEGNIIALSSEYVGNYTGDLKNEVTGILYHETTHVWQWDANGEAPSGLIEGIADFIRLKQGLIPSHWVKKGGGNRWDEGYDVTAQFLDYCNDLKDGFVGLINRLMRYKYSDDYFVRLLGMNVDDLWKDYKTMYGD